jgi:hypothetical protein
MTIATALPVGRRERLRNEAVQQIKAAGMEQLRSDGAAGLSLRAVARAVGMSSPGSTATTAAATSCSPRSSPDVYDDLAETIERARDAAGPGLADRLRAASLAYYDWSEAHRAEFGLVFGAPVPSYSAPPDGSTTTARSASGPCSRACWLRRGPSTPTTSSARRCSPCVRTPSWPSPTYSCRTTPASWASPPGCGHACTVCSPSACSGHLLPQAVDLGGVRQLYEAEVEDALAVLGLV